MKRLVERFGKYNLIAFTIMAVGVIVFLITPLSLMWWDFDTDILGLIIFIIGLAMWGIGKVRRKK